ncbi:exocyst complex component 7 [Chrysoperla carnea]|uniref:exocyst complex component 7 n=1 Tax=Chrysoperla carnea TaxID=189513 RepID=UPI001D06ABAC|nr:exocyst complex component 7 [Chrysoperla carnea]
MVLETEQMNEVDSLLEKQRSNLDLLKSRVNRSSQLASGMVGMLSSFEDRLARLEDTILPVYHETESLQRCQQNMERTLQALDHVISLYSVSHEVEQTIRKGPGTPPNGTGLNTFLLAMNRLTQARLYFEKNNSQSVELENVSSLYNIGCDALKDEFKELLSKHSKPVLPIVLIDLISIDEDTSNEDSPVSLPSLPETAQMELNTLSSWLLNAGRQECLDSWATIRGSTVVKSLKHLKDHRRSASGGSISGMAVGASPMMRAKFQNRHETSRRPSTRRLNIFEKKANRMLQKASQTLEHSTGLSLGIRRPSSQFDGSNMNDDLESDAEMERYLVCVAALHRLMQAEQTLISSIIPTQYQHQVFEKTIREAMDLIVQDGENIATRAKRCINRHDFAAVLVVFPIIKQLRALRPDFERTVEHCDFTLRNKFALIITILEETAAKALEDFMESVRTEGSALPPDGTVHELTSNVLVFLEQLRECGPTAGIILAKNSVYTNALALHSHLQLETAGDQHNALLGIYIKKVLAQLNLSLLNKSEAYSDPALKAIFRLNNTHHTLVTLQRSRLLALAAVLDAQIEQAYHDMIQEHKQAYQLSWSKLLNCICNSDDTAVNLLQGGKLRDKDRALVKEKFAAFNKELEEMSKVQRGYSIPDVELRESLKRDIKEHILPKYDAFYCLYCNVQFTKNADKYLKYNTAQVSALIDCLFDVAA